MLEFTYNFSVLISLLVGIGIGLTIALLFYLLSVLLAIKKTKYIIKADTIDVPFEECKKEIDRSVDLFKDKKIRGEDPTFNFAFKLSYDLMNTIAKKFFPNSEHPLYELTVDECLMLIDYIAKRMDEVFNYKGLKFLRRFKVSTLFSFAEAKEKIEENSIVRATKKFKVKEAFNSALKVINVINPVHYIKKYAVTFATNMIIKKICIILITVTGEETYKIYSKSVFNNDFEIDSEVDKLKDELSSDVENAGEEDLKEIEED